MQSLSSASDALPQTDTVEDALMVAMVRIGQRLKQRLPGEQIELGSIQLLKTVEQHGSLRVSTLAELLHLDPSTVSRHVSSLEERGLLERTTDPDDRRASRVVLSEYGADCMERGTARRRELLAAVLLDWDAADRETFRALLHRLSTDLELHGRPS